LDQDEKAAESRGPHRYEIRVSPGYDYSPSRPLQKAAENRLFPIIVTTRRHAARGTGQLGGGGFMAKYFVGKLLAV
jgi:hypothetical protein